jgi:hypothetical protein
MSNIFYDSKENTYSFPCPHCGLICLVKQEDIRCTIFRHAVFKDKLEFVPPHASKTECDRWVKEDLVYGCGKPFKFDGKNVSIIDYI